jgi:SAM-dependent methyltransferase
MSETEDVQWILHKSADAKRFSNRIKNPYIYKKEINLLSQFSAGQSKPGIILEIGCGEGNNAFYLSKLYPSYKYVGIDYSFEKVVYSKKINLELTLIAGDGLSLPIKKKSIDRILIRDVLHHLDSFREELIYGALELLREDGVLMVIEGNVKEPFGRIYSKIFKAERGMQNSTPEKFGKLCSRFGCEVIIYKEPTFLIRTINYFIGWDDRPVLKVFYKVFYGFAFGLEEVISKFVDKNGYGYMIAFIRGSAKYTAK